MSRFKTGTPARVDKRTVDFSKMEEQFGDERVVPFSFSTDPGSVQKEQVSCWLTYTNEKTHEIIKENIDRSPLFSGMIEGTGPRYCPSIEDKVVKFADKNRHQVFIEPEGLYTNEMYLGGMSSVHCLRMFNMQCIDTVPGLENAKIVRNAYAIEYDCIESMDSCYLIWSLKILRDCLVQDSLTEVRDMRRQLLRELLRELMLHVFVQEEEPIDSGQISGVYWSFN